MLRFLYPEGKTKALTFSYDDAQIYDRRLVEIFNRYGLKATFHLNAGTLDRTETEADGSLTEYIRSEEVKALYAGHEVACHGVHHPFMDQLCQAELAREIWEDKKRLEELTGRLVVGMSYPFGNYDERIVRTAESLGIEYSRTVEDTMSVNMPKDFLAWHPSCHHNKLSDEMIKEFLNPPAYRKLPLLYVWGHSFEFHRENTWEVFEEKCKKLSGDAAVWYATNAEIMDYIKAIRGVRMSADGKILQNPSGQEIFFYTEEGKTLSVGAGETVAV